MTQKIIKVLLVEDQNIARNVETHVLEDLGCVVDATQNGITALELLGKNNYDIIFMDIGLPDVDGLTLTETIRHASNTNKSIPIIALTAYGDEGYKNRATWVGMNGFIVKPLTEENCKKALGNLLTD